jgi:acetyltransferase-like isoleucine patch superfamily enzyme
MLFSYRIKYHIIAFCTKKINSLKFRLNNVNFRDKPIVLGNMMILNYGTFQLGNNFKANGGSFFNPIGGDTNLRFIIKKNAFLNIGNNCGISNTTIVCWKKIVIEDNVLIGGGCKIWDTDFHSLNHKFRQTEFEFQDVKTKEIHISKNVFIGANTTILKGVFIGENSIIAANSLVTKVVPENQVWGGSPAVYLKDI